MSLYFILIVLKEINAVVAVSYDINDSCAKLYVPDVVKNINVKVFSLMSRTNEARHIE